MSQTKLRNPSVALQYPLSNTKQNLGLMSELQLTLNSRIKEMKKSNFKATHELPGNKLALCINALKTPIVLFVSRLFDQKMKQSKRVISFKMIEWFKDNEAIKKKPTDYMGNQ